MAVNTDVVVEWDLDNDGDYDETEETITGYVLHAETVRGRNWPSMLQGKSTPGQFVAELDNSDDRFSYFNTSSPLATAPFSLRTGRRIRVRTSGFTPTDPTELVRDRFDGVGAIGNTENGLAWTTTGFGTPTGGWQRVADGATAGYLEATGESQYATVDASSTTGYAQARIGPLDTGNTWGLIYRFTDANNFGFVFIDGTDSWRLKYWQVSGGTATGTSTGVYVHPTASRFLGIHVYDTNKLDIYLDGTRKESNLTAYSGAGTDWGLYAVWPDGTNQRAPTFEEFYVWDTMRTPVGGEVWQGKVKSIIPSVDQSGRKIATLRAEGMLANVADITIRPPHNLGETIYAGAYVGEMVGNCLGRAGELHPPESNGVRWGSFKVGPCAFEDTTALTAARRFEEAEQGFLYETPIGGINFDAKSDRGSGASAATFTDDPAGSLHYESFELLDWRNEIINRVESKMAVVLPTVVRFGGGADVATGNNNKVTIANPDFATDGAVAGDLVVNIIASTVYTAGETWITPPGWRNLRPELSDEPGQLRVFAKVLTAGDVGGGADFYADASNAGGAYVWQQLHAQNWRGDIADGVAVAFSGMGSPDTTTEARAGDHEPPVLFPPWGREPCYYSITRHGTYAIAGAPGITAASDRNAPNGYRNMSDTNITTATSGHTYDCALQTADKNDSTEVEEPSIFDSTWTNFDYVDVMVIAIRGKAPESVTVSDLDSQFDHNTVRTHANPATIFPDSTEAGDYCDEILARYGDDSPIVRFSYTANRDTAHRTQALARQVGDKITIEADNGAGMGINADFVIESIRHRFTNGNKLWTVTYECAEA